MKVTSRKEAKEKGDKFYFTGEPCKNGHTSKRRTNCTTCMGCEYIRNRTYLKDWYAQNRSEQLVKKRNLSPKQRQKKKEQDKDYYLRNKDKLKQRSRDYYRDNKEQVHEKRRNRLKNDSLFRCTKLCNDILRRVLLSTGHKKNTRTQQLLGYSGEDIREHLESLFREGMSWENYGEWHVDHLYPVNRYLTDGVDDPAIINRLTNLAPMWSEHNFQKDNKTIKEYLEIRPDLKSLYGDYLEI